MYSHLKRWDEDVTLRHLLLLNVCLQLRTAVLLPVAVVEMVQRELPPQLPPAVRYIQLFIVFTSRYLASSGGADILRGLMPVSSLAARTESDCSLTTVRRSDIRLSSDISDRSHTTEVRPGNHVYLAEPQGARSYRIVGDSNRRAMRVMKLDSLTYRYTRVKRKENIF